MVNPELHELQQKVESLQIELAKTQGEITTLKHTAADTTRQTIWQFVIFTVTMAGILLGGIKYQSDTLRAGMNLRFDSVNNRFDSVNNRFEAMEKRIEQSEKNIIARFEDLKQEVRASRK